MDVPDQTPITKQAKRIHRDAFAYGAGGDTSILGGEVRIAYRTTETTIHSKLPPWPAACGLRLEVLSRFSGQHDEGIPILPAVGIYSPGSTIGSPLSC